MKGSQGKEAGPRLAPPIVGAIAASHMEMEKRMSCQPRTFFRCMVASSISIVLFLFYFRSSSSSTAPTTDLQSVVPISYLNSVSRDDTASPRPVRPLSGTINQTSAPNLIVRPHPPCTSSAPRVDPARPLPPTRRSDPCLGRYIYVYRLPSRFNTDMLKECKQSSKWSDVCYFTSNAGMGQALGSKERVFSKKGWFATNQFALDVIFHNRMKQYKCLTSNSSMASAIYVPFYAGLDIARYLWRFNISMRDAASLELVKWLAARPEWKVMGGRDHFMVGGRISWDFERQTNMESDWGNQLLLLPEVKNMTMLTIESSPYSSNDFSIPYPTYFHPSKDGEVFAWRDRMRRAKRPWLFAFAGARRPNSTRSIRDQIMDQCRDSNKAMLLQCDVGKKCHEPASIMKLFQSSVFCLQPQGDSYTRRSTFDAMVAGCIPVFFHPGSAYIQYAWHLPKNYESYSVFISENDVREGKVSIEKILAAIPPETLRAMREVVIGLLPRIIYADPKSRLEKLEDAFDLAVKGVIDKVERVRKGTKEGSTLDVGFEEKNIWKHRLVGHEGVHEWEPFFSH